MAFFQKYHRNINKKNKSKNLTQLIDMYLFLIFLKNYIEIFQLSLMTCPSQPKLPACSKIPRRMVRFENQQRKQAQLSQPKNFNAIGDNLWGTRQNNENDKMLVFEYRKLFVAQNRDGWYTIPYILMITWIELRI